MSKNSVYYRYEGTDMKLKRIIEMANRGGKFVIDIYEGVPAICLIKDNGKLICAEDDEEIKGLLYAAIEKDNPVEEFDEEPDGKYEIDTAVFEYLLSKGYDMSAAVNSNYYNVGYLSEY